MASLNHFNGSASKPSLVMSSWRFPLSRSRSTTFSPNSVGQTLTRKSISLPLNLILMRPSWGSRRSLMSSSAMIFKRLVMAIFSFCGGRMTS